VAEPVSASAWKLIQVLSFGPHQVQEDRRNAKESVQTQIIGNLQKDAARATIGDVSPGHAMAAKTCYRWKWMWSQAS
jgi:hypothetical protein